MTHAEQRTTTLSSPKTEKTLDLLENLELEYHY